MSTDTRSKNFPIFSLLSFILFACLMTSCIAGVGVVGKKERLVREGAFLKGKNQFTNLEPKSYKAEDVSKLWGPADYVSTENCCQVLGYKNHLSFKGLLPWVVLPLPLVIPAGYCYDRVYFKNGRFVGMVREEGDIIAFYGFAAADSEAGFRFGEDKKNPSKVTLDFCKP